MAAPDHTWDERDAIAWARTRQWGTVMLGNQIVALICPLCAALVPDGARPGGPTLREVHMEWHERCGGA